MLAAVTDVCSAVYGRVAPLVTKAIDFSNRGPAALVNIPTQAELDKKEQENISVDDCDPMSFVVALASVGASNMPYPKFTKIHGGVIPTFREEMLGRYAPGSLNELTRAVDRKFYSNDSKKDFEKFATFLPLVNKIFPLQPDKEWYLKMQQIWHFAILGVHSALVTSYKENELLEQMAATIKTFQGNDSGKKVIEATSTVDNKEGDSKCSSSDLSLRHAGDEKTSCSPIDILNATERATLEVWQEKALDKVVDQLKQLNTTRKVERFGTRISLNVFMKNQAKLFLTKKNAYSKDELRCTVDGDSVASSS